MRDPCKTGTLLHVRRQRSDPLRQPTAVHTMATGQRTDTPTGPVTSRGTLPPSDTSSLLTEVGLSIPRTSATPAGARLAFRETPSGVGPVAPPLAPQPSDCGRSEHLAHVPPPLPPPPVPPQVATAPAALPAVPELAPLRMPLQHHFPPQEPPWDWDHPQIAWATNEAAVETQLALLTSGTSLSYAVQVLHQLITYRALSAQRVPTQVAARLILELSSLLRDGLHIQALGVLQLFVPAPWWTSPPASDENQWALWWEAPSGLQWLSVPQWRQRLAVRASTSGSVLVLPARFTGLVVSLMNIVDSPLPPSGLGSVDLRAQTPGPGAQQHGRSSSGRW